MSRALLKFIRVSPTKSRLIAREIQGMNAEEALAALEFTPNKAAKIIYKVLASAVANSGEEAEDCVVTSCRVDNGPVLKRFKPRARGMASGIRKPTAHILVVVDPASDSDESTKAVASKKSAPKVAKADKSQSEQTSTKSNTSKSDAKNGDDLTKVKGIGKVYEGKLNDEGVFTYEDIANMTDEKIAIMEEKYSFKGDFKDSIEDAKKFIDKKGE